MIFLITKEEFSDYRILGELLEGPDDADISALGEEFLRGRKEPRAEHSDGGVPYEAFPLWLIESKGFTRRPSLEVHLGSYGGWEIYVSPLEVVP